MSDLNEAQNPTFYRVRIKDGHNAVGLLVSAAGKRCIPSTQFWLTVDACAAYRFPHNAALHRAGTARGCGVHHGTRGNSGLVRQGLTCHPSNTPCYAQDSDLPRFNSVRLSFR